MLLMPVAKILLYHDKGTPAFIVSPAEQREALLLVHIPPKLDSIGHWVSEPLSPLTSCNQKVTWDELE